MTRKTSRKQAAPTFADVRKLAAYRAHLTRTQNALRATKDRAERAALRAKLADLSSHIEPLAAFVATVSA
ncbi:MAG TPA: hypothetical protein VN680_19270 [Burkholderiaceae bacterium]|nr:hypothetical protein [Burkholderiaceae bacterium]